MPYYMNNFNSKDEKCKFLPHRLDSKHDGGWSKGSQNFRKSKTQYVNGYGVDGKNIAITIVSFDVCMFTPLLECECGSPISRSLPTANFTKYAVVEWQRSGGGAPANPCCVVPPGSRAESISSLASQSKLQCFTGISETFHIHII